MEGQEEQQYHSTVVSELATVRTCLVKEMTLNLEERV